MSRIMQEIGQYHQARMNQAIVDADEADSQPGMSGAEDTPGILSILFADVQEKGFILSKSWGELLGSLSKYQGKLMVTENGYAERERRLKEQEEKIKQQTGSWPEEVVQLKSDLTCKENSLVACQTELVHVNKMAELVDVEHSRTKEILEDVMRGKTAMEAKCAQYEMDLNAMSQKLQAAQEELEIKDQLVVKLEQQMVKEIAEGMTEITSLKGLVESREDLLEDEKKAHNETNIKLRQLQIAYQALKRNLDSAGQYGLHMPMLSYHDNPHTMLSSQNQMTHYTSPGPSNVQLWRPVSNVVGAPPAKVRRVVTNTSRTEDGGNSTSETDSSSEEVVQSTSSHKKRPGRPPKSLTLSSGDISEATGRVKEERPSTSFLKRKLDRPPKSLTSKLAVPVSPYLHGSYEEAGRKKRGPKPKKDIDKKSVGKTLVTKAKLHSKKCQPIECHKCHQLQPSITALQLHITKMHPSQKPYKCLVCGRKFTLYYNMKSHEKRCS